MGNFRDSGFEGIEIDAPLDGDGSAGAPSRSHFAHQRPQITGDASIRSGLQPVRDRKSKVSAAPPWSLGFRHRVLCSRKRLRQTASDSTDPRPQAQWPSPAGRRNLASRRRAIASHPKSFGRAVEPTAHLGCSVHQNGKFLPDSGREPPPSVRSSTARPNDYVTRGRVGGSLPSPSPRRPERARTGAAGVGLSGITRGANVNRLP